MCMTLAAFHELTNADGHNDNKNTQDEENVTTGSTVLSTVESLLLPLSEYQERW